MTNLIKKLPRNVAMARMKSMEEAAAHLETEWTDVAEERHQGTEVAHWLRMAAVKIHGKIENEK